MIWKGTSFRRKLLLWWHVKVRPTPLQREFNRGDPVVKITSARILAELKRDEIRDSVLALWDGNNGWIPGADYKRLADALGVPHERTRRPGNSR